MMRCQYPNCDKKQPQYFICWADSKGVKACGMVCGKHDRLIGRKNLMASGMALQDAIAWEYDNKSD